MISSLKYLFIFVLNIVYAYAYYSLYDVLLEKMGYSYTIAAIIFVIGEIIVMYVPLVVFKKVKDPDFITWSLVLAIVTIIFIPNSMQENNEHKKITYSSNMILEYDNYLKTKSKKSQFEIINVCTKDIKYKKCNKVNFDLYNSDSKNYIKKQNEIIANLDEIITDYDNLGDRKRDLIIQSTSYKDDYKDKEFYKLFDKENVKDIFKINEEIIKKKQEEVVVLIDLLKLEIMEKEEAYYN